MLQNGVSVPQYSVSLSESGLLAGKESVIYQKIYVKTMSAGSHHAERRMRNLIIRNGVWQIKAKYFTGGPHNSWKGAPL